VDHPNLVRELDSIDNPKGITPVREGDLLHASRNRAGVWRCLPFRLPPRS
jgi:hypothetical protein